MRILIVTQYFWPENFRITDLAIALKDKGHEVTILTGMPNYPAGKIYDGYAWWNKKRETMQGIPIVRVPLFARRESRSWQLVLNYLSFALSACLLAPWMLRKQEFDCIFTFEVSPVTVGIPAVLLRRLKKAPMLFWVQDLWPETLAATGAVQSSRVLSGVAAMVRAIYRRCDKILVQSKSFVNPIIKVGGDREKIAYFPNWAETLYQPVKLADSAPERQLVPTHGFIVMFAGNLGEAQSLDTIVNAAKILSHEDVHWVFLGDGRRRNWLEIQQQEGLDKVHILGSFPMEKMPTFFSLADAMLVTLRDDPVMSTTIPGKVQSYLACGRPLLGALNGAGVDVIRESGSGFCVDSGDHQALADAVLKMRDLSEARRKRMGQAGRAYYEKHFDRDRLVEQLESWMIEMRR
ncbi:MAG: glycosyltransferase family 4 protein, partial [Mariprofundaceae bacterium]|nr:glycosyltransferase family 4 protein [Mariprofundaceae bacterium]